MAKIKKMNVIRLITPKDIISLFFTDYIKSRYKTVNSYLLFYNNSIKANFTVKKSGKYLSIKSFNGDNSLKGIIKKSSTMQDIYYLYEIILSVYPLK